MAIKYSNTVSTVFSIQRQSIHSFSCSVIPLSAYVYTRSSAGTFCWIPDARTLSAWRKPSRELIARPCPGPHRWCFCASRARRPSTWRRCIINVLVWCFDACRFRCYVARSFTLPVERFVYHRRCICSISLYYSCTQSAHLPLRTLLFNIWVSLDHHKDKFDLFNSYKTVRFCMLDGNRNI